MSDRLVHPLVVQSCTGCSITLRCPLPGSLLNALLQLKTCHAQGGRSRRQPAAVGKFLKPPAYGSGDYQLFASAHSGVFSLRISDPQPAMM